jgi:hypothetical protein
MSAEFGYVGLHPWQVKCSEILGILVGFWHPETQWPCPMMPVWFTTDSVISAAQGAGSPAWKWITSVDRKFNGRNCCCLEPIFESWIYVLCDLEDRLYIHIEYIYIYWLFQLFLFLLLSLFIIIIIFYVYIYSKHAACTHDWSLGLLSSVLVLPLRSIWCKLHQRTFCVFHARLTCTDIMSAETISTTRNKQGLFFSVPMQVQRTYLFVYPRICRNHGQECAPTCSLQLQTPRSPTPK